MNLSNKTSAELLALQKEAIDNNDFETANLIEDEFDKRSGRYYREGRKYQK